MGHTDTATRTQLALDRARLCVILNPGSGRKEGDALAAKLEQALAPRVAEYALRVPPKGAQLPDVAKQAVQDGFDIIVAAGGDGTQSAVAGAVAGSNAVMGVIPGGTFNYFARDLGVGETVDDALETLLGGQCRDIDVGDVNGLIFLNNISFGAYPEILKTREDIYHRWGRSRVAAYWSVIKALARLRHPLHLTAQVAGQQQQFNTALAFVAKSAFQLDTFGLEGADAIRQGHFALLIARARRPVPLIGAAFRLAFGLSARNDDFDLICADETVIQTRSASELVAHDGEKTRMRGPFHLRVRHGALRVLVPADPASQGAA